MNGAKTNIFHFLHESKGDVPIPRPGSSRLYSDDEILERIKESAREAARKSYSQNKISRKKIVPKSR